MKKILFLLCFQCLLAVCFGQQLRLAVYQYADNPRIQNLEPLAAQLQKQLGLITSVKSYPTVHALIKGLQAGEADLAFINTFGYLLLQLDSTAHPMQPLAALVAPEARDNYKTAFVLRCHGTVATAASWQQHTAQLRLALVAKGSTSGNMVPRLLLNKWGIGEAESAFKTVTYAGTHARALQLLLNDSADLAAMGSAEWERLPAADKDSLQLLTLSTEIPLGPVLINRRIKKGQRNRIQQALLQLHTQHTPAFEGIRSAWTEARQATHFIAINAAYYKPYLQAFGSKESVEKIIRSFVN